MYPCFMPLRGRLREKAAPFWIGDIYEASTLYTVGRWHFNSTLWKLSHLEHWRGISFLSGRIYVIYDPDYKSRTALGAPGSQISTIAIHIERHRFHT